MKALLRQERILVGHRRALHLSAMLAMLLGLLSPGGASLRAEDQDERAEPRFVSLARKLFLSTDSESRVEFHWADRGNGRIETYLCIAGISSAATDLVEEFGEGAECAILAAEFREDGFLRSRIYTLTAFELEEAVKADFEGNSFLRIDFEPKRRQQTWRFLDSRTGDWQHAIDPGFTASKVELILQNADDPEPGKFEFSLEHTVRPRASK